MAKWNEVLRIEEALGAKARFAGLDEMPMRRQVASRSKCPLDGEFDDEEPFHRQRRARNPRAGCRGRSRLQRHSLCGAADRLVALAPAEPVAPWTGSRPAHEFGAHSVQGVVWDDIDLSGAATSEDCLHLNVWTPAAPGDGAQLPVMVWIYGGGFVVGSGADRATMARVLRRAAIVVVTVNHRLNALGFLAHPELTAESEHHSSGATASSI